MTECNGWKNYETWCVNLWLSNAEPIYREVFDLAMDATADDQTDRYELAETLKEYVDDLAEATCPGSRSGASFVTDLLGAALSEVDWYEIADAWIAYAADVNV